MCSKSFYKMIFIIAFILTFPACNKSDQNKSTPKNNFDWLIGSWERTNDKPPKQTFEKWEKLSVDEYIGLGYTLEKTDTVFKEYLRIFKQKNNWIYEVTGVNENPTLFSFDEFSDTSFSCTNYKNEFPKKIKYIISNDTLTAEISGNGNYIQFIFLK